MARAGIKGRQGFPTLGPNDVEQVSGSVVAILIGDKSTLIEAMDLPLVVGFRWHVDSLGYVSTAKSAKTKPMRLHRVIMGLEAGDLRHVDHINHDKLDNRRENLRVVARKHNHQNMVKPSHGKASQFKGVTYTRGGKWRAYIKTDGKQISLGAYEVESDAAKAYDAGAIALFGEYAYLNFPDFQPSGDAVERARAITARRLPAPQA